MALLIDSNVFISLERRGLSLAALVAATHDEPLALASVTASELLFGVHQANTPVRRLRREALVNSILDTLPVVSFDLDTARRHAAIWAELRAAGRIIGPFDLIIAATALTRGYAVLTENLREFERVPELDVRPPVW